MPLYSHLLINLDKRRQCKVATAPQPLRLLTCTTCSCNTAGSLCISIKKTHCKPIQLLLKSKGIFPLSFIRAELRPCDPATAKYLHTCQTKYVKKPHEFNRLLRCLSTSVKALMFFFSCCNSAPVVQNKIHVRIPFAPMKEGIGPYITYRCIYIMRLFTYICTHMYIPILTSLLLFVFLEVKLLSHLCD